MAEKTDIYKLIYKKVNGFEKYIRILGRKFFERNKCIGRMIFNNKIRPLKDKLKLKDIKEDKLIIKMIFFQKIQNKSYMFEDCFYLTSILKKGKNYKKKSSIVFNYDKKYNNKYERSLIFDYVTNVSFMFSNCISLISLPDISKWNTNNVKNMSYMFSNCKSLISLPDISKWNINNVTNMSFMFYNCSSLISLPDISEWNTDNVNKMSFMFSNCNSLKSLPIYLSGILIILMICNICFIIVLH